MKLTKLRELKQILLKKFQILIIINQTVQLTHTLGLRDNLVTGVIDVICETDVTGETGPNSSKSKFKHTSQLMKLRN